MKEPSFQVESESDLLASTATVVSTVDGRLRSEQTDSLSQRLAAIRSQAVEHGLKAEGGCGGLNGGWGN